MNSDSKTRPWGFAAGLLAACAATLIGVVSGLDPETILVRATGAGLVFGITASVVSFVFAQMT